MAIGPAVKSDQGISVVGFGILLPVLLLVVFGVIDFVHVLNAQISLSRAVHEGVRTSAQGGTNVPAIVISSARPISVSNVTVTPCPAPVRVEAKTTVVATARVSFVTPIGAILPGLGEEVVVSGRGVERCHR
jgi:Flp pilus assembly protein TadG